MPSIRGQRTILTTRGVARVGLHLVGLGVASLLVLEVVARLTDVDPQLNPRYRILSAGLAEFEELVEDAYGSGGTEYYDEFVYAQKERTTRHVNFTSYYSARHTPDSVPLETADHVVWTFGGSTMENTETTDRLTIANTWARVLNRELGPTHLKNFGTGGFFSSYELIKFQKLLRDVPDAERPSIAIFYDGYNDALVGLQYGPGSLQKDLSLKLEALVESRSVVLLTYGASDLLARYSTFWRRTGHRVVESKLFPLPEVEPAAEDLSRTTRIFRDNVRMARATCETFGVRCLFILQPLLPTKQPLAPVEQDALDWLEGHPRFGPAGTRFFRDFYANAARLLADEPGFIDASGVLDGRADADFYDVGHVGATTPPVIGERTAALILARLESMTR